MRLYSIHDNGGDGLLVRVETSMNNGLPNMILVGFAGKSLDESRERIKSAFAASSVPLPKKRITVNLSPSDIPKDGAHYDLAIAAGILQSGKLIPPQKLEELVLLGELGLDGSIKPVRGIIGKILTAKKHGQNRIVIPSESVTQASLIGGVEMLPVASLKELFHALQEPIEHAFEPSSSLHTSTKQNPKTRYTDFSEIIGQAKAKRALEIAAAGGHNVLLNGPPGVGKSMLAKALPSIMSDPSPDETLEITHIHSLSGDSITELITTRPFRSPHHSSSDVSIIGGGQRPKPGEVSLAHRGVLFLDEFPEFRRGTIESLRQPLEDGTVNVSRAKESVEYPARFMLVATKNPCPCGFYGSTKPCVCSPIELQRYQKKLSGPILDRIDIHVTVDPIHHKKLLTKQLNSSESDIIRGNVEGAIERQMSRFKDAEKRNAHMGNKDLKQDVEITNEAKELLDQAAEKLDISARVYMKLLKVAQTIADLEDAESIQKQHIAEALQYRPQANEYA